MASQPHIQALSPNTGRESLYQHERSSSIPIMKSGASRTFNSPIPSPSDYTYGSSIPKSLERPKSNISGHYESKKQKYSFMKNIGIILTMDAIKSKHARIGDPVELSLLSQDKQNKNDEACSKEFQEDISSGKYI